MSLEVIHPPLDIAFRKLWLQLYPNEIWPGEHMALAFMANDIARLRDLDDRLNRLETQIPRLRLIPLLYMLDDALGEQLP